MATINISKAYADLEKAKKPETKAAIKRYINQARKFRFEYGYELEKWPRDILRQLMHTAAAAYDLIKDEEQDRKAFERIKKAAANEGISLADFM